MSWTVSRRHGKNTESEKCCGDGVILMHVQLNVQCVGKM